jgi:hypothetical protein
MLDIIELIDYLFSNNYYEFFKILNKYLMNNELLDILENIKWHYLFNDIETAKKIGIDLIKLIHLNNK